MPKVRLIFRRGQPRQQRGFLSMEVLLAAVIFGFLAVAVVGAFVYGRQSTAGSGEFDRATALADEGVEAVRNIRDAAYSNLVDGTYGLAQSGGQWTLSGSSDTTGIFTRQVVISTVDSTRKSIATTVSWSTGGVSHQVVATGRLTNWAASITPPTPTWPNSILAGSLDLTGTTAGFKVATSGSYAYVIRNVTGATNFFVVNISSPSAPTLSGSLTLAGTPTNIAVSGNFVYVANSNGSGEMQIVNVITPTAPALSSTFNAAGTAGALGVAIRGTTAFLVRTSSTTTGTNEFLTINVATPTAPALLGSYNNNINMNEVYVPASGNFAYVATNSSTAEFLVVNIATLTAPTLQTSLNLSGSVAATTIAGVGSTVYVGRTSTLASIDITTPTAPVALGTLTTTGSATINDIDVDSAGLWAFLATANTTAEFQLVNITTPATMSVAHTVDVPGTTSTLNGMAYNSTSDLVVGTGAAGTQEVTIFTKN